jgi:hypothetical protein
VLVVLAENCPAPAVQLQRSATSQYILLIAATALEDTKAVVRYNDNIMLLELFVCILVDCCAGLWHTTEA